MKKNVYSLMLSGLALMAVSCSSDENVTTNNELSQEAFETKKLILERGVDQKDIYTDFDNKTFIIGDIGFPFEWSKNIKSTGRNQKNYRTETTVSTDFSNNITYFIDSTVPSNYENPIGWATYYWSVSSKNINFSRVFSAREADIVIVGASNPDAGTSQVFSRFPNGNGNVGNRITIWTNRTQPPTGDRRISLMMHELGHSLGLEHSDMGRSSTAVFLGTVTGTSKFHTENICGSIMRSTVFNCDWNTDNKANWSDADKATIDILYGYDFSNSVNN